MIHGFPNYRQNNISSIICVSLYEVELWIDNKGVGYVQTSLYMQ